MEQLDKLFREITASNPFAIPELVNNDENYYYFRINGGWVTEIAIDYLNGLKDYKLYSEAKYILNNYKHD